MDLPGTNINAEVNDISWHTTTSNLVIEVWYEGANQPNRLTGRLLERTLLLNDPSNSDKQDVPVVQLNRSDDCNELDKRLEHMMQEHGRDKIHQPRATP